jgi:hypothetical protein
MVLKQYGNSTSLEKLLPERFVAGPVGLFGWPTPHRKKLEWCQDAVLLSDWNPGECDATERLIEAQKPSDKLKFLKAI